MDFCRNIDIDYFDEYENLFHIHDDLLSTIVHMKFLNIIVYTGLSCLLHSLVLYWLIERHDTRYPHVSREIVIFTWSQESSVYISKKKPLREKKQSLHNNGKDTVRHSKKSVLKDKALIKKKISKQILHPVSLKEKKLSMSDIPKRLNEQVDVFSMPLWKRESNSSSFHRKKDTNAHRFVEFPNRRNQTEQKIRNTSVHLIKRKAMERSYLAKLQKLLGIPPYSKALRRIGIEGIVLISFRIDALGGIHHVNVKTSSGHKLLDQSALAYIKNFRELPPPPDELQWDLREIIIPINYRL